MQEVKKVKKAGAGAPPTDDTPETIQDGPVAFSADGDHESTPPDIIIEK